VTASLHELVDAFADGELPADEAAKFREHLVGCAECQAELHDIMMLQAVMQTHAPQLATAASPASGHGTTKPADKKLAPVISLGARRKRAIVMVTSALAVAAAIVFGMRLTRQEPVMLAMATARPIEARLSYEGADRYRPYDVMRAAGTAKESVPVQSLATLEKRGDSHGVGVGYLLSGEPDRAMTYLSQAQASAAVLSDEAAAALQQHDAETALVDADKALAESPGHVQAMWNKALALRELGLPLSAAQLFDGVAARAEPGWSDEAKKRAAALRAAETERERAWREAAQAGKTMIVTGAPVPAEVTRGYPGLMRGDLYQAVRSSPSKERVLGLVAVAEEIDRAEGTNGLAQWVRAVAKEDFARRAPLAASYARLAADPGSFTPAQGDALLASLRKAKADDLVLGALVLLGRASASRAEVRHIAEAQKDPWSLAIADQADAQAALAKGDAAQAATLLTDADKRCLDAHVEYRCAYIEYDLADAELRLEKTADAQKTALAGLQRARAAGVDARDLERRYFVLLAEIARARNLPSLATAYVGEARLHMP
jgi:cellulose synthase operon protein C